MAGPSSWTSKAVREIAWRAQLRLAHRYRRLSSRKLHPNKICVAMARELAGFLRDIARQVKVAGLNSLLAQPTTNEGSGQKHLAARWDLQYISRAAAAGAASGRCAVGLL
jgi:hypothetical protein